MKSVFAIASVLFSLPVFAANVLEVPEGATYTVQVNEQRLVLESLRLGDGATIRFAEGVERWQLRAERAEIGSKVLIDARGLDGLVGVNAPPHSVAAAKKCSHGAPGATGSNGSAGAKGVDVHLQLGLHSFGDLTINSAGGKGGNGGQGGDGLDAADSDGCRKAPIGGDAGSGGSAGAGGSAGDVNVSLWAVSSAINVEQAITAIATSSNGGLAGQGGKPGKPGAGSEGHYIKKRTLTGNRAWQGGGKPGAEGSVGALGLAGQKGDVLIEHPLRAAPTAVAAIPVAATAMSKNQRESEIKRIKQQLRALLQRIEALEANPVH